MSERDTLEVPRADEEPATVDEATQGRDQRPGDADETDDSTEDTDTETTDEEEVAAADAAASTAEGHDGGA